jgi:FtsH-binding integral membrane protein
LEFNPVSSCRSKPLILKEFNMSFAYEMDRPLAARAAVSERAGFIRRTYLHLAGAILGFVGLEILVFNLFTGPQMDQFMASMFHTPWSMLIIMAAFIGVGFLARWWAYNGTSQAMAYAGLALYVVFQAFIFVPILHIAVHYANDPTLLPTAAVLTLSIFGGLTAAAFLTKKDFSFLGPILSVAGFLMLGVIIAGIIFGFTLGLLFSFFAVALACGFILYDTSNVIHRFRTDQHVAAALELFASVAFLFFHILRILLMFSNQNR